MSHDPVAFTARFEASLMEAIAPLFEQVREEGVADAVAAAVRGAVQRHVDAGDLPISAAGADRLARVVASVLAFQAPPLAPLALPAEERARPFAGVAADDLREIRERFAGWVAAQADEEACHLVVEGTMRAMLDGEGSPI